MSGFYFLVFEFLIRLVSEGCCPCFDFGFFFPVSLSVFDCLRYDKENKTGVVKGYFLWLIIGYGFGKYLSIVVYIIIIPLYITSLLFLTYFVLNHKLFNFRIYRLF